MEPTTQQAPQQPQSINMNVQTPPEKSGAGQAIGIVIIILIIVLGGVYFWMMKSTKAPQAPAAVTSEEASGTILNDLDASADANIDGDLNGIDAELQ